MQGPLLAATPFMTPDELKRAAAAAALSHLVDNAILGVGTGSTVNHLIDLLAAQPGRVTEAVSSSQASTARLQAAGVTVLELDDVVEQGRALPVYIDGADEIDASLAMIKGGGGALTREKILAAAADRFVCIVDASKQVQTLGGFALPIEVIPMARALVARQCRELGGTPRLREGFTTDNGNAILDVAGLSITDPVAMEKRLSLWPGVVTVGLFALRGADVCLVAGDAGVRELRRGN